ncbi:MAG: class III signal peptide-containing protein [archaeon]|jgi:uncharacterized protein (UPF0333 family)
MKFNKGQGALEYLLLIGGAVLIAVIVIALLVGMGGQNKSNVETQARKATDVLSTPTPPTLTSVAVVSCSADDKKLELRLIYTGAVADSTNVTYAANLYEANGVTVLTSDVDIPASGDEIVFNSERWTPALDCATSHAYSVELVATATSAAGQSKSATSMKYNFVYP